MDKKIVSSLAIIGMIALPVIAFAQPNVNIASLNQLISAIEGLLWIVFGVLAVIMFVIAGILFLTAGGAPEKVAAARSAFIWGVVGIVVAIIAYSIVAIVSTFLAQY